MKPILGCRMKLLRHVFARFDCEAGLAGRPLPDRLALPAAGRAPGQCARHRGLAGGRRVAA